MQTDKYDETRLRLIFPGGPSSVATTVKQDDQGDEQIFLGFYS